MKATTCLACRGTGVGDGQGLAPVGQLLPLCRMCDGRGILLDPPPAVPPYIAMWLVGTRYVVRMIVPKTRGVVELDIEWQPNVPPKRGKKALKPFELAQYRAARDQALKTLRLEMGGSYELVEAGDRH